MPGDTARENGKKGGRPKGSKARHTLKAMALRAYIIDEVVKEKKKLVKAMIDKAIGGDIIAIRESLDRTLGKSKEQVDVTSGGEKIEGVKVTIVHGNSEFKLDNPISEELSKQEEDCS